MRREIVCEPGIVGWFSWANHWMAWWIRCRTRGHQGEYICRYCGTVSKWVDNPYFAKPRTIWVGK